MVRAWNKTLQQKRAASQERRVFAMIALPIAILTLTTIALVAVSTRPTLVNKTFPSDGSQPGVRTLDWPTIYELERKHQRGELIPAEIENSSVRLAGYMLPIDASPGPHRQVTRFLLVPDPGNWLHPAHPDDGVLVSIAGHATTPLRDQTVWVQGRLFLTSENVGATDIPCAIVATKID